MDKNCSGSRLGTVLFHITTDKLTILLIGVRKIVLQLICNVFNLDTSLEFFKRILFTNAFGFI